MVLDKRAYGSRIAISGLLFGRMVDVFARLAGNDDAGKAVRCGRALQCMGRLVIPAQSDAVVCTASWRGIERPLALMKSAVKPGTRLIQRY